MIRALCTNAKRLDDIKEFVTADENYNRTSADREATFNIATKANVNSVERRRKRLLHILTIRRYSRYRRRASMTGLEETNCTFAGGLSVRGLLGFNAYNGDEWKPLFRALSQIVQADSFERWIPHNMPRARASSEKYDIRIPVEFLTPFVSV